MSKPRRMLPALCTALALLCGCAAAPTAASQPAATQASGSPSFSSAAPAASPLPADAPAPACYFAQLREAALANSGIPPGADDFQRVQAAYLYVISRTNYAPFYNAPLTEHWRYLDACGQAPTVYEVMATGPLAYGIGECEHYAAALMVLLGHMGYESRYVSGLTYSVHATLVDHAWLMVNIAGAWYHIDPQLEDNVTRGGKVAFRYFLKDDQTFEAHHRWGDMLPGAAQELPACPTAAPAPGAQQIWQAPAPDIPALEARIQAEQDALGAPLATHLPEGEVPPFPVSRSSPL